jgi:hypothetical protein
LKLNEQTNKLAPGTTPEEKENYVRMRAVYANGFWIFDGTDGFNFVDAGTGRAVEGMRVSADELKTLGDEELSNAYPPAY